MDKTIDKNPLTGREFYLSVIKHYGFIPQCIKLKEECTELIEVIDKIIEAGITPAQADTHSSKLLDDFICENVDVAIVIGQFNALLGLRHGLKELLAINGELQEKIKKLEAINEKLIRE